MLRLILQGVVVGVANIIPGVSGGTMMVAMGLYDRLIHAITHLKSEFGKSMKLILPILIGAALAIVILSRVFEFLLEVYPIPTNFAFCGLIAGSLPFIFQKVKGHRPTVSRMIPLLVFFAIVILMAVMGETGGKAADVSFTLINEINNTTIPALESDITALEGRMDVVEADIAAIKNRIQSIQWVHAYADKNLTLVVTEGTGEFTAAMLEAEVYVTSNDAGIVQKIVDGDVSLEILANQVATTRSIAASPFGTPALSKVDDNVVKITLNWADLTALYASYSAAVTGDPVDYQLAVKVTDANGNNVVTDFAGIVIKK